MKPSCKGIGLLLLFVLGIFAPAGAQTVFDIGGPGERFDRYVVELPLGGYHHHNQMLYPARGFRYSGSYSLVYLVNILPGEYSVVLSYPVGTLNLAPAVSIFDRWPYASQARRFDLPMGPTVRTMPKKIEYRWHVGISPKSTSTLLYISVEVPAGGYGSTAFPHSLSIMTPPSMSANTLDRGVTFLTGPTELVLTSQQGAVSYVVERPDQAFDATALPVLPIPGDLVKNGSFKDGLNSWLPHRDRIASQDVTSFSLHDNALKITGSSGKGREGVMQKIGADVKGMATLILRADIKVTEQTLGGTGLNGSDAPIAIAIGYRDAAGKEVSKDLLFWKGFYALSPEEPNKAKAGQKVPKGSWYRCIFDLMQLDPKPATILFISLEGSGWPAREGWIREVHLIKSGGEK